MINFNTICVFFSGDKRSDCCADFEAKGNKCIGKLSLNPLDYLYS